MAFFFSFPGPSAVREIIIDLLAAKAGDTGGISMEKVIETMKAILSDGDNTIRLTLSDITIAELLESENEQQSA